MAILDDTIFLIFHRVCHIPSPSIFFNAKLTWKTKSKQQPGFIDTLAWRNEEPGYWVDINLNGILS